MKAKTTEEFIKSSVLVHGNKYDYSNTNYLGSNKIPVRIICPVHGPFSIRPDSHIGLKHGCKKCGIISRSIKQIKPLSYYIDVSVGIHGNKYDYSNSILGDRKLTIKCNTCNTIFRQTPSNHISNEQGCPKCSGSQKSNTLDFVEKSKLIHGNKYDYSKVNYKNCSIKVLIFCKKCNRNFKQMPSSHLGGHGCHFCSKTIPLGKSLFIEQSTQKHKNKYNYSEVNYINNNTPVIIFCKSCKNKFIQKPVHHMNGSDCPNCSRRRYSSKIERKFFKDLDIIVKKQQKIGPYVVDGLDKKTQTIYEFLGDYWHGNPRKFSPNSLNLSAKKSHRELYLGTINRFKKLKTMGYKIKYIWESDFKKSGVGLVKEYIYGRI